GVYETGPKPYIPHMVALAFASAAALALASIAALRFMFSIGARESSFRTPLLVSSISCGLNSFGLKPAYRCPTVTRFDSKRSLSFRPKEGELNGFKPAFSAHVL